ncbi:MAG TPA: DUF1588 domain-containing protein [Gemmataceae bacterium]|nr:DUF1588 domain-containing protein [Gemmataceae bacterium]
MPLAAGLTILLLIALAQPRLTSQAAEDKPRADLDGYRKDVEPFFKQHCLKCHGPDKQKGKLALHSIDANVLTGKDIERWKAIAERLALGEMPPDSEPRPDARIAARVLAWIKAELAKGGEKIADAERKLMLPGHGNRIDHDALFGRPPTEPAASPARLWRFSPQIYSHFVPRITGQKPGGKYQVGQVFSTAPGEGFKDYADLFAIDEPTISQLMRNAEKIVEMQSSRGPGLRPVSEFLTLVNPHQKPSSEQVQQAIRKQFELALFRSPTAEEMKRFLALYEKNVKDAGQVTGARTTLATILLLPEALYRMEIGGGKTDEHGRRFLTPRELAYAIAFALTDAGPDATLLKAAERGQLTTKEDVRREVTRILNDQQIAKPRILRFFEEYFEFPTAEEVFKDFPNKQPWRPEILVNDTRRLIEYILDQDKDVLKELLTTNKSFVNYQISPKGQPLPGRIHNKEPVPKDATKPGRNKPTIRYIEYHELYSLPPDWKWTDKQPVELPADQRAGILTQPSWLAAFATNNENHAIRRGKWIRERLLGGVVPDLPISVNAQLPDAPEKTLRQRMEITRQEYCWQCHQKMNPLGLAFENYDYIGRYRTTEQVVDPTGPIRPNPVKGQPPIRAMREVPVDATGLIEHSGDPELEGPVANAIELMHKLAASPRVRQVFIRHAFRYWMGRNETLRDAATLQDAERAYVQSGGSMKALITELLTSDSFLYRFDPKASPASH